ncbi:MAG: UMP kinase [Eubacteriales bacterium]|nr:UMP kinase [Eubacteriales bacterium]
MENRRILLKLSGEALAGEAGFGVDQPALERICREAAKIQDAGMELAIVVGGGNYWRGRSSGDMDRTVADNIGMLATTMNSLAIQDCLRQAGYKAKVLSAIDMPKICELFRKEKALEHIANGYIVILAAGTGNPFFSTDSTAALRGAELEVDLVLKATLVDGCYDKDPHLYPDAKKHDRLTYEQMLADKLQVIDATAAALLADNQLDLRIFDITKEGNMLAAAKGEKVGTLVSPAKKL